MSAVHACGRSHGANCSTSGVSWRSWEAADSALHRHASVQTVFEMGTQLLPDVVGLSPNQATGLEDFANQALELFGQVTARVWVPHDRASASVRSSPSRPMARTRRAN